MRFALYLAAVWALVALCVVADVASPGRAVLGGAFVTVFGLLGFRVGGTGGPTDSSSGSSGGPGASV